MEGEKQNLEQLEKEKQIKREKLISFEAARRNHAPLYKHASCESELELDGHGEWTICPNHGRVAAEDRKKNPRHEEERQRMLGVVRQEFEADDALAKKQSNELQTMENSAVQYSLENCPRCNGLGKLTNIFDETISCDHKVYSSK
ncbi:MAG: hypothetical protein Q8P07_05425 [bacterium]|nr:hypothetical protein [bacterium]